MTSRLPSRSLSWIDRVTSWIEKLILPTWLAYLILYITFVVLIQLLSWVDGYEFWGVFSVNSFFNALWVPLGLAGVHYLNSVARTALKEFRPVMDCDEEEYSNLEFQMTKLPKSVVLSINGVVAIILISVALSDPSNISSELTSDFISLWVIVPYMVIGFSFFVILFYQTVRRLLLVYRMYSLVKDINIFKLQPLYSLSGLNVKTGFVWIIGMNLNIVSSFILETGPGSTLLSTTQIIVEVILIILVFLLPVLDIHKRIQQAKENLLNENGDQLRNINTELHQRLDDRNLAEIRSYERGISALISLRSEIENTHTWPWNRATFRGFLSAVFLPIFIFLIQQVLSRYL